MWPRAETGRARRMAPVPRVQPGRFRRLEPVDVNSRNTSLLRALNHRDHGTAARQVQNLSQVYAREKARVPRRCPRLFQIATTGGFSATTNTCSPLGPMSIDAKSRMRSPTPIGTAKSATRKGSHASVFRSRLLGSDISARFVVLAPSIGSRSGLDEVSTREDLDAGCAVVVAKAILAAIEA